MHADIDWHAFAQCKKSGCIQGHRKIAQVEISFRTKEVQGTQAARRAPRTKLARGATALAFPEDVTFAFWAARYTSVDELEKPYTISLTSGWTQVLVIAQRRHLLDCAVPPQAVDGEGETTRLFAYAEPLRVDAVKGERSMSAHNSCV
eukprot:scaffold45754_cov30-Tisochrysis_lutea.AAC.1